MKRLTKKQASEIQALKNLRDEDIDLSDIPAAKEQQVHLSEFGTWPAGLQPTRFSEEEIAGMAIRFSVPAKQDVIKKLIQPKE